MKKDALNTGMTAAPAPFVRQRLNRGAPGAWRRIKLSGAELSGPLPHIAKSVDRLFVDVPGKEPTGHILKADRFSSVIQIQTDRHNIIIKNEHARSRLEFLAKGVRKSRAAKSWEKGRLLVTNNFETAKPLALIEDYFLFFKTSAFFICSYLPGRLLKSYLDDPDIPAAEKEQTAEKVIAMVRRWHKRGVTHGDPKASNIIVNSGRLYLIDLDNVTVRPPGKASRRALARDWAIVLHNWQNQPDIRQMALGRILGFFDTGRHYFAARLIKKFWKTEPIVAGFPVLRTSDTPRIIKELAAGKPPANWHYKIARPGVFDAFCPGTNTRCMISRRAFPKAERLENYFRKKRLPRRGVLAMALSLKICGFHLPGITAGGLYEDYEYLLFTDTNQESFDSIWETLPPDTDEKSRLLNCLGATTGRLHAMGFIHGRLSLTTVQIKKTAGGYEIGFSPSLHTRRKRWASARQMANDWRPLKNALIALLPPEDAAIVGAAYEKARRQR